LKNKDESVKLNAACCLADIIRIYAPNSPFLDDQNEVRRRKEGKKDLFRGE
jgi:hypothetical protein